MAKKGTIGAWFIGIWAAGTLILPNLAAAAVPVPTSSDSAKLVPRAVCEELRLNRELTIYKDPTLFLADIALIAMDPVAGWRKLASADPRLTTLDGTVQLQQLGEAREFKNFGVVSALYERAEPRFRTKRGGEGTKGGAKTGVPIVSVMLCGANDAYRNTLGFVVLSDLEQAREDRNEGNELPPSIYPNPIPKLSRK